MGLPCQPVAVLLTGVESELLIGREDVSEPLSQAANQAEWDRMADDYQNTHGEFLGDQGFVWGPEGMSEDQLGVLGPLAEQRVLELGCGAAQCSRWVTAQGGWAVGVDLSWRQLQHAQRIDINTERPVPIVQATATALPFHSNRFDVLFSCFGALQFVADYRRVLAEAHRVLRPGGRFAFSVTHPMRWVFQDDPGPEGMVACQSYWDRRAYVERAGDGELRYAEHHRTLGDWVSGLAGAGFTLLDLVEPQWPEHHDRIWGGWSALRGEVMPGTAIFVASA